MIRCSLVHPSIFLTYPSQLIIISSSYQVIMDFNSDGEEAEEKEEAPKKKKGKKDD